MSDPWSNLRFPGPPPCGPDSAGCEMLRALALLFRCPGFEPEVVVEQDRAERLARPDRVADLLVEQDADGRVLRASAVDVAGTDVVRFRVALTGG